MNLIWKASVNDFTCGYLFIPAFLRPHGFQMIVTKVLPVHQCHFTLQHVSWPFSRSPPGPFLHSLANLDQIFDVALFNPLYLRTLSSQQSRYAPPLFFSILNSYRTPNQVLIQHVKLLHSIFFVGEVPKTYAPMAYTAAYDFRPTGENIKEDLYCGVIRMVREPAKER